MAKRSEYTIQGPPAPGSSPSQLHKSLTIRRENKGAIPDLRSQYRHSADFTETSPSPELESKPVANGVATTPNLPPTPPVANGDAPSLAAENSQSEATNFRSTLVTPVNQNSPPTPDNTPPRPQRTFVPKPWLGTQPSFASTGGESFKTAREEMTSDDESAVHGHSYRLAPLSYIHPNGSRGGSQLDLPRPRSPLAMPDNTTGLNEEEAVASNDVTAQDAAGDIEDGQLEPDQIAEAPQEAPVVDDLHQPPQYTKPEPNETFKQVDDGTSQNTTPMKSLHNVTVRRGPSLRDRLRAANRNSPSASTEKFASIIGWNNNVPEESSTRETTKDEPIVHDRDMQNHESLVQDHTNKRLSGLSAASTIGAMVIESSPLSRRRTTLRKVQKNNSLRSASSPLPASARTSNSLSDSPHRLLHKKARLSNDHRHSFGSDFSRSHSVSSSAILPKPEIIKVAVIPERSSSLHTSSTSSRRHSLSASSARTHSKRPLDGLPPSSWQRKRTLSESDQGRARQGPVQADTLQVPPRKSSLSAPTSRSASRANSITSESLRVRRQEAESDLRKTLDKMESDRLASSLRGSQFGSSPVDTPSKAPPLGSPKGSGLGDGRRQKSLTPGTSEWAALRPLSSLETPFSQPSFQSASPEIIEATAINFFPHHNQSLQLIEPNVIHESRAVQEVRKQHHLKDESSSPLRNPRRPPEPPQFHVEPPSPAAEMGNQFENEPRRWGSARRRPSQRRSDSFVRTMTRGLSLKNAKNKHADEDLDGSLHPMWKPRAFWDDAETQSGGAGAERGLRNEPIYNSLGLPQERTVITGPMSLVRRISERRRQNQMLMKQSSHTSLQKLRASRKFYKTPIMGMNFRFMGLHDLQDRLLYARQRKEDERRERRRAALRERIGANVISQGDSRFPASNSTLIRA